MAKRKKRNLDNAAYLRYGVINFLTRGLEGEEKKEKLRIIAKHLSTY